MFENNKIYRDLRTGDLYRCVIVRGTILMVREATSEDTTDLAPLGDLFEGERTPPALTVNIAPIHDFVEEGNCG